MADEEVLAPLPIGDHVLADFLEVNGYLPAAMLIRGHEPEGPVYLWRLSQDESGGYDTYDSCVVAACDEASAKRIHPSPFAGAEWWKIEVDDWGISSASDDWATSLDNVTAVRIGMTLTEKPGTVVCASYNAS